VKKPLIILLSFLCYLNQAQAQSTSGLQPYGKIDSADLRMTKCDFEPDANALVLIDHAVADICADSVVIAFHKRVKIFNTNAHDEANIRLEYYSADDFERIYALEAQTVRMENNKIIITRVDPQMIYTESTDKYRKTLVFAFPDVKPGSIIEYQYRWKTTSPSNMPTWHFQEHLPTRYSRLDATMSNEVLYSTIRRGYQPFVLDTMNVTLNAQQAEYHTYHWAKANVHSFIKEPYTTPGNVNFQSIMFRLKAVKIPGHQIWQADNDTWTSVVHGMIRHDDFGGQMDETLAKQDTIIKHVKTLKDRDAKIAWLFNLVKNAMTWNKEDAWYTDKGVRSAWTKKTGNSAEINLILYNLLVHSGIPAYPMAVSTRDNGAINLYRAGYSHINKTVVYIPVDSTFNYVLDASGKYNTYNDLPAELVNTYGIKIDYAKSEVRYEMLLLKKTDPVREMVAVEAEIKPDNQVTGQVTISSMSYEKADYHQLYDELGAPKYLDAFRMDDNNLKLSDLKMENMDIDTLPLVQTFNFKLALSSAADNYIYFTPGLFFSEQKNPFLREGRLSDIDFGHLKGYTLNGVYKLPSGYKIDAVPENTLLNMFDKSISLKRVISVADGSVSVSYQISFRRVTYQLSEYPSLHDFYKKMYEILNEPVVLKKAS